MSSAENSNQQNLLQRISTSVLRHHSPGTSGIGQQRHRLRGSVLTNRFKFLFCISASAFLLVIQYQPGMALPQQCQDVLDRYHSGVTPQTLSPLGGRNALYVYQTNNGHCGWGTGNNRPSQSAAQELAYSKCKRYEDSQRTQHNLRVPCTLVGLDGAIVSAGIAKFADKTVATAKRPDLAEKVVETRPSSAASEQTKGPAATLEQQEKAKKQLEDMARDLAEKQKALHDAQEDLKRQQAEAARDAAEKEKVLQVAAAGNSSDAKTLREQQKALQDQQDKLALATKTLSDKQKTLEQEHQSLSQQQSNLTQQQAKTSQDTNFVQKLLAGIILPTTEDPNSWMMRVAAVPVQEQQFCRIVDQFYDNLAQVYGSHNEIKRNSLFRERQQSMAALLQRGEFSNWVVKVKEVTQAPDGSAAVMLQPPCRVMLGSDACQKNGSKIQATIPANSPIYRELEKINSGDFVVVSGKIVYAESNEDKPLPTYAVYQAGSHCSATQSSKQEDVFVTDVNYLVQLR